jgi:polysaccharide deacetylase 2 family uncharacterized protein YibQ
MKKSNGFLGFLRILGITPHVGILFMILILLSGIMIGLIVKNAARKPAAKKRPAVVAVAEVVPPESPAPSVPEPEKEPEEASGEPEVSPAAYGDEAPFVKYALPVAEKPAGPVVAIIVDDMGVDMLRSKKVLELDAPVTVSYLTYAPNLQSQIDMAAASGKEVMLHVPMEALNNTYDYGPEYLASGKSRADNQELLKKMLARARGYVAVNNHMGSRFTEDYFQMNGVMEVLKSAGLGFVDSKTTPKSGTKKIAGYLSVPYGERDVFLDDSNAAEDISRSLAKLELLARRRGYAVAIGHPRDATIEALSEWLSGLKEKGVTLVPVSYIMGLRRQRP